MKPTFILVLEFVIFAYLYEAVAAGSTFRVTTRSNDPADPSTSIEQEQDSSQDVFGNELFESNNATLADQSKRPLSSAVGAQDPNPLQDDQEWPSQTDDMEAPRATKIPSSATDVKATVVATSTDMGTSHLADPVDEEVRSDDVFLRSIRKRVVDERAVRLHLRQQLSKLAIVGQDLQRRLASGQENVADLQRQLRTVRLNSKKLREQLDQSRKAAGKREIQMRKQLDAQNQKVRDQSQKLADLQGQAQAKLAKLTSQLQAAADADRDDKKQLKERDAAIAKVRVDIQQTKAASDATLQSAGEKAHKASMESEDRIRFLTNQIQQLRTAMKKESKALAAEIARSKQRASFLQSQMDALSKQEHTEVARLKAEISTSHEHEEQTKDKMMTHIADLQASLQKLQEAKTSQDRDLGARSHEIELMKGVMRAKAAAMKAQRVRIRKLFQQSRKEERKQKGAMQNELKETKSKVSSLELTKSTMKANTDKILANLTGALNASHQQKLLLAAERSELRRELRSNGTRLQAEVAEVAALKKRLAEEEDAHKKADAAARKAHNEFVQAKAVANQLQGTVPQLLEQVKLANKKRDAEKALRLQAKAKATNQIAKTNNAAEKQMQEQVDQIDKVLPLMNAAASQAGEPAVEDDDTAAGEEIDKVMDGSTGANTLPASLEGAEDIASNADASKQLASAGGAAIDAPSLVAELSDLDRDGDSLAAVVQK